METSQSNCSANQLTGFYMRPTLVFNGLTTLKPLFKLFWKFLKHSQEKTLVVKSYLQFSETKKSQFYYQKDSIPGTFV